MSLHHKARANCNKILLAQPTAASQSMRGLSSLDYVTECICLNAFVHCVTGVIAHYYVTAVHAVGGVPEVVRTDRGTENVTMAALQELLTGDRLAHRYGTSPSNQRIEAWWSFFRTGHIQWWLDLFSSFSDDNSFHPGNERETDCLRFCFMTILREHLKDVSNSVNCFVMHYNT